MKLSEIKNTLIDTFFTENSNGVTKVTLSVILESIGRKLNLDLSSSFLTEMSESKSNDPSKAFKKFTEGRVTVLTIDEEDGSDVRTIFAAIRYGTKIYSANMTTDPITESVSDFKTIKSIIRQSKTINEDIVYEIRSVDY